MSILHCGRCETWARDDGNSRQMTAAGYIKMLQNMPVNSGREGSTSVCNAWRMLSLPQGSSFYLVLPSLPLSFTVATSWESCRDIILPIIYKVSSSWLNTFSLFFFFFAYQVYGFQRLSPTDKLTWNSSSQELEEHTQSDCCFSTKGSGSEYVLTQDYVGWEHPSGMNAVAGSQCIHQSTLDCTAAGGVA